MKLQPIFEQTKDEIRQVAAAAGIDVETADGGKTGLKAMYALFHKACTDRAYDETHPGFTNEHGVWKRRVLPYTGRNYCWYYDEYNCNDTHVATLLRQVKAALTEEKKACSSSRS